MAGYSRGADAARVGATALIAAAAFLGMFGYTTNRSLTAEHRDLHIRFERADGLNKGDAVLFRGVKVGEVKALSFDGAGSVIVRTLLTEHVTLAPDTRAALVAVDIFGRQSVVLREGSAHGHLPASDTIAGATPVSLTGRVEGLSRKAERLLGDSTLALVHGSLADVAATTDAIGALATRSSAFLDATDADLGEALRGLTAVAANLESATDPAAITDIRDDLADALARIGTASARMDTTSALLASVLRSVESGDGTIGRLIDDPALYDSIVASLSSLDALLRDLRENPKRYINVSVF